MKKINLKTEALICKMCMGRKSNKEIAAATGLPLADVHAWRSRNNLTRAKVEELLEREREAEAITADAAAVMEAVIRDDGELEEDNSLPIEDALGELIIRAGGRLDGVVGILLKAIGEDKVCDYCRNKENCGDLQNCAPALTEYLRKELTENDE